MFTGCIKFDVKYSFLFILDHYKHKITEYDRIYHDSENQTRREIDKINEQFGKIL